ncbi:MAG: hypothetical protein M0Q13_09670 [Methanothrix sp.]|nr:hypothetical protein [Methanothrix sp.]
MDLLGRVFSQGIRERSLWQKQCRQTAKILEPFLPGILGRGQIRCPEILNGSANNAPLNYAAGLDPGLSLVYPHTKEDRRRGQWPQPARPCLTCLLSWTAAAPWRGQR